MKPLQSPSIAPEIDIEFTLRTLHRAGMLGSIFTTLGETGAYVGDVFTVYVGKTHAIRKVLISVYNQKHCEEVIKVLNAHEAVSVISQADMVFERHKGGKIHSSSKKELNSLTDLRYIYTPGVARVCSAIQRAPAKAKQYTTLCNSVGIFTNGTRVLGLGDIGLEASLPVMEGKAAIYDRFVGISATPILIDTKEREEFVQTVLRIAPSFGAIHLEDICVPDCFYIERALKAKLPKPVMHDDQHGTATVTLSAIMSILRMLGRRQKHSIVIGQIGLGAAGFGIASLLHDWGAEVHGVDPDPEAQKRFLAYGGHVDELSPVMKQADVIIACTSIVGLIKPDMIKKDQIVLAISNPEPEIYPEEALEAGASFAADGRTINNALAYPGLFKGALMADAEEITAAMKIRAAEVISSYTEESELVPSPFHPELHDAISTAVAEAAGYRRERLKKS